MAQIGSGNGSSFKHGQIDTRQTWQNGSPAPPDSATRMDAEALNDLATAVVDMQEIIGANARGVFGSIAARLNQFIPGTGPLPGTIPFTNTDTVLIPAVMHNLGDPAVLFQVYNAAIPAVAIQAGALTLTLNQTNYDLTLSFSSPQTGAVALSDASPQYRATFVNQNPWTVAGATHALGTSDLQWQIFDAADPAAAMEPGSFTIDATSHDVVVTFAANTSGTLLLATPGPTYAATFTGQTSVSIPGTTHGLGSAALLYRLYDTSSPRAWFEAGSFTVHPSSYDVSVVFGVPFSGRLVLSVAQAVSGNDFDIRDGGIVNTTAVRMHSSGGNLYIQPGSNNHVIFQERTGTVNRVDIDALNTRVGIGVSNPTFQLQLSTGQAAMPGGGPWLATSDERVKEVLGPFPAGLATVLAVEPVRYRYNGQGGMPNDRQERVGVIAQAIQAIAPYMVGSYQGELMPGAGYTDILTYDGNAMIFVLINAVKELAAQLDTVQAAVAALTEEG